MVKTITASVIPTKTSVKHVANVTPTLCVSEGWLVVVSASDTTAPVEDATMRVTIGRSQTVVMSLMR